MKKAIAIAMLVSVCSSVHAACDNATLNGSYGMSANGLYYSDGVPSIL